MTKISKARRVMPKLIASSIVGVSPMAAPKGSVFAMRKKYLSSSKVTGMARKSDYSARDRLRNVSSRKYNNNELLSASRVQQIFGFDVHSGDYWGDEVEDSEMYHSELELDDTHFHHEGEQLELELENIDELEGKFRMMMRRYESAIHAMAADALQWHDLMCDIEEDEHLEKEFNKFQMLRKLSGGTM